MSNLEYALSRARRLVELLELALDSSESDESRRIARQNADHEIGILAAGEPLFAEE